MLLQKRFEKVYQWVHQLQMDLDQKCWFTPCAHLMVQMQKTIDANGSVDLYVHIIDVDDAYQGQGIGSAFLQALALYVQKGDTVYDRLIVQQCQTQRFARHLEKMGACLVLSAGKWDAIFESTKAATPLGWSDSMSKHQVWDPK